MQRRALLVSDGRDASGAFAPAEKILHVPIITSRRGHVSEGFQIQSVNAYHGRLQGWLRRFSGVAPCYLPSYPGWRPMTERDGDRPTPRTAFARALG